MGASSSSPSYSSPSRSSGSGYSQMLYFDPEADSSSDIGYSISDDKIRDRIAELTDATEQIWRVSIYRHPLNDWQLTEMYMYHAFVVFETEKWWWSIEKNEENVTIQRSKKIEYVRDKYRRHNRPTVYVAHGQLGHKLSAKGKGSVQDLVNFLWMKDHVREGYNFLFANCKYFARDVFNETNGDNWQISAGVGLRVLADLP